MREVKIFGIQEGIAAFRTLSDVARESGQIELSDEFSEAARKLDLGEIQSMTMITQMDGNPAMVVADTQDELDKQIAVLTEMDGEAPVISYPSH